MKREEDDPVLEALAAHLRDDAQKLAPFERRLDGDRPGDSYAMKDAPPLTDQDLDPARLHELYRPLSSTERDALIAGIDEKLHELAPARVSVSRVRAKTARESVEDAPEGSTGRARGGLASVVPLRVIAPLAIAAALLLGIVRGIGVEEPLPGYALEVRGGESELRGSAEPSPPRSLRVRQGSSFELLLRPAQEVEGDVAVRVFVEHPGGARTELIGLPTEISPEGAIRVRGRLDELPPQESSLVTLVGRPSAVRAGLPPEKGAEAHRITLEVF